MGKPWCCFVTPSHQRDLAAHPLLDVLWVADLAVPKANGDGKGLLWWLARLLPPRLPSPLSKGVCQLPR